MIDIHKYTLLIKRMRRLKNIPTQIIIHTSIAFFLMIPLMAQNKALELSKEYKSSGDIPKAIITLEEELSKNINNYKVFKELFETYLELNDLVAAEKSLQKFQRKNQINNLLLIDQLQLLSRKDSGESLQKKSVKVFDNLLKQTAPLNESIAIMRKNNLSEQAVQFIKYIRRQVKNDFLYSSELLDVYRSLGNKAEILEELLVMNYSNLLSTDQMLNAIQLDFTSEKDLDLLENTFIERVQENENDFTSTELLVWLYSQKKQFLKAMLYEKSLDRLYNKRATGLMELATLALNSQDYAATNEICRTVITMYPSGNEYFYAKKLLLYSSERKIKDSYPIDTTAVKALIKDYQDFALQAKGIINPIETQLSVARLQAFYLGELTIAEQSLLSIIEQPRAPAQLIAEAKLDLGDIYILKDSHWDASLTYSQVEKMQKEQPLGYEAKFRNARANYFKGEFQLATSHLDILKLATTREIANNAIELSLFIKSNMNEDSTDQALQSFAQLELLEFTHKVSEALDTLTQLLIRYRDHSLTDDLLFKQAKLFRKSGRYYEAITSLDALIAKYPTSILADDALFEKATIYEKELVLFDEAMTSYQQLLTQYPGSTLTNESRKRFRILRGDKIN